jgi:Carboxypeptidase regulatory-like domain/TonB dependent receptor
MRSVPIGLAFFLIAVGAFAQANNGTITGTISDPAGAVVPGAAVEVKNSETGVVYRGGASETGNYVISVPAGTYELTVTVTGFKKFVQQNVQVIVAVSTRRDVKLEVGSAADVITIQDTAPLLKTESGEVSHRVTTDDANSLPVLTISGGSFFGATTMGNLRNPLAVSSLLPGVSFGNDQALVVNGMPSNSESIHIDGQDATGTIWKVIQQNSQAGSVDAIQEVSVQTSNFAAEYGQVGGGYFNFTMKSGTNQFHGSGYDYFVNEALNAGLPYTDAGTTNAAKSGQHIRNAVRRTDYGATVGGPIAIPKVYDGKDKSFFFFSFEQFRENRTISNGVTTVPTVAYRGGDFTSAGCYAWVAATNTCNFKPLLGAAAVDPANQTLFNGEIFDPQTTRTVNGALVRDPFVGQKIQPTRFDPVFKAIQNYFPLPTNANLTQNYSIPTYTNWAHDTTWSVKLDHSISPTMKISGYVSRLLQNSPNANGYNYIASAPAPVSNRNVTARINFDDTLQPTLLLHIGIGYIWQRQPTDTPEFDQSTLGLHGYPTNNRFPSVGAFTVGGAGSGLSDIFSGGYAPGIGPPFIAFIYEEKPTANTNLTWVKGNHTYKFGGELTIEGYPEYSRWRSNGQFNFSNAETSDPWQNLQPLNVANPTGFGYASFMLGLLDQMQESAFTQTRLGSHGLGLYAQDTWKVTRRLTLDYGLRWDYQTYLKESWGRQQMNSFDTPNPAVGGRLGAGIFEGDGPGRCGCQFSHNYPFAFGPRVGVAYQINPKTVLRAGAGVTYGLVQTPAGASYQVADFQSYNASGYGISPFPNGWPSTNPYNVVWPIFRPDLYPTPAGGYLPPGNAPFFWNPSARPPRTLQWSVGFQREVMRDLVVDLSYVGNRGVWWAAPSLDQIGSNSISDATLSHYGLSRNNPADMALLGYLISDPRATARGFLPAYAGMPPNSLVSQQIRPVAQWNTPGSWLGPPVGKTWYDSLQLQGTKRYSHGLSAQASFVWSHAMNLGTGAETGQFVTGLPVIEDLYNYAANKQLNQLTRPLALVISGTYTTPKTSGDGVGMRVLSQVVRDWQLGWLLRYQSGALIQTPSPTTNTLASVLQRTGGFNPSYNLDNPTGAQRLLVDPNSKSFDPTTQQLLNPAAWSEPATGQWGVSAPFYEGYRWQRQPSEAMNFGRNFRVGKEGRYNLQIRAEFQNIFNRHFYSMPATGVPGFFTFSSLTAAPSKNTSNVITGGYGTINTTTGTGAGAVPRSGQAVARFTF